MGTSTIQFTPTTKHKIIHDVKLFQHKNIKKISKFRRWLVGLELLLLVGLQMSHASRHIAPLKPLSTILPWCLGGFKGEGGINWRPMVPRDANPSLQQFQTAHRTKQKLNSIVFTSLGENKHAILLLLLSTKKKRQAHNIY